MRFETQQNIEREIKAIKCFVNMFGGTYRKLHENDIDFKVFKDNKLISFVEVKGRHKCIDQSFPLPIAARKLVKLSDKKINPVIIWACDDGIIYSKVNLLKGIVRWGGRIKRQGSTNDQEVMLYFDRQKNMKTFIY